MRRPRSQAFLFVAAVGSGLFSAAMTSIVPLLPLGVLAIAACKPQTAGVAALPYESDFSKNLGPEWFSSGGHWTIEGGTLFSNGANNAPVFLQVDLPSDVVVEFDAMSETSAVDTKCELMTDGRTHQSGYVFVLGGWKNSKSIIARLDEHGPEGRAVISKSPTGAVEDRWYRWRIEKRGGSLRWFLDDNPYLSFEDAEPLSGPHHNRFAFNNWQNRVRFDNLKIRAISGPETAPNTPKAPTP